MNKDTLKKHTPQAVLLILCAVRTLTWIFNMVAYLALYLDKTVGFMTDLSMCIWGIVGVVVALGLVFRLVRKISAWMVFAVAALDIIACLFFMIVNGGLMMLFILISLFFSVSMLLLSVLTLRSMDAGYLSDRFQSKPEEN